MDALKTATLPQLHKGKFTGLDTLRGVAAVAVALYHYLVLGPQMYLLKSGHLAVDFFFCLSGFVISYAYEQRLLEGLTTLRFVTMRLVRFYPYYLLGLALGIAEWMLSGSHRITGGDASSSWVVVFSALASNVLFLPGPWFSAMSPHANFPVNFPSWSLFLELLINLVYVALVRFLSMRVLIGIVAVFGCAVSAAILMNGQSDLGYAYETFLGGFLRCGFSFFMGILLFRLRGHMRIFPASRLWLVGVLLACLAFAAPSPFRPFVDLIVIIAISPANVWLAASPQKNEKPEPALFRLLGETSYGMYAIHVPLIGLLTTALWQLSSPLNHYIALGVGVAFIAFTILVTAFLDRSYDRPLRKMLLARLFWTANKRQSVA